MSEMFKGQIWACKVNVGFWFENGTRKLIQAGELIEILEPNSDIPNGSQFRGVYANGWCKFALKNQPELTRVFPIHSLAIHFEPVVSAQLCLPNITKSCSCDPIKVFNFGCQCGAVKPYVEKPLFS